MQSELKELHSNSNTFFFKESFRPARPGVCTGKPRACTFRQLSAERAAPRVSYDDSPFVTR
ncbi:hypothetical protein BCEP27_10566 [Burkholderia cepacia]